ncbi:MAG: alpha/beta hydrolase [Solirubrobacteraceae bacterium]|nr:alpha/beta hydrolase [Solirubrobacteraceae bacterium]
MGFSLPRIAAVGLSTLLVLVGMFIVRAPQASALDLPLLKPRPAPAPAVAPVHKPISSDPGGPARGTVIMVHAGGWAGHDAHAQGLLLDSPGDIFRARGWRVVSIDYHEGTAGLQDVLDAVGAELARRTGNGPLCLYGESSGAHLALVAAARMRSINCVIGLGTPTDLPSYQAEAVVAGDDRIRVVAYQMARFFGNTPETMAPWNLVALAPRIQADVLLLQESDDQIVSAQHRERFRAVRPTTQVVELEAGDTAFMHGTVSAAGRSRYAAAIGSFADRVVAARNAERSAARTGCSKVGRSVREIDRPELFGALRCLARKDGTARREGNGSWSRTSVRMYGEVNAARLWSQLRRTVSGRRALVAADKRRAQLTLHASERSQIILRALKRSAQRSG